MERGAIEELGSKQQSSPGTRSQNLVDHNSLHDADEEGGEVVPLSCGEESRAAQSEEVREEALDDMKVRGADLREDGGVAGEEGENRATQVADDEPTKAVVCRPRALHESEYTALKLCIITLMPLEINNLSTDRVGGCEKEKNSVEDFAFQP